MTDRYDAVISRKDKNGKWRSTRIGVAFPSDNGRFNVVLSALPMPGSDGQAHITLFPAEEKEGADNSRAASSGGGRPSAGTDMNDSIPFAPEWR